MTTLTLVGSLSVALSSSAVAYPADNDSPSAAVAPDETPASSATPTPSLREEAAKMCRPKFFFRINSFKPRNFFVPRTHFIDGPGGTMTATVKRQHRVYFEIELEKEKQIEISKDALLRRLKNNFNPLVAEELIVETGHDYAQQITPGMYGNMWYRVFGYRVGFSAWRRVSDCGSHKVTTGIASVPARVEGWKYWETKHPMYKGRPLSKR
ncbi:hypothetical protein [Streptosporangium sp. NPDC087985]|uniref:hypothetical protein n=1 Tax=Streptosporangium sp. NPDC087985 TaxID=3366196 RepID=UPI0038114417